MEQYNVIGVMSGTSLDGLDLAYCQLTKKGSNWTYEIIRADTIPYPTSMRTKLRDLHHEAEAKITQTDTDFGHYIGEMVNRFVQKNQLSPDIVASHGHTVFHKPEKNLTRQIGNGQIIADTCQLTVVCDFRSMDVSLGGQGAPLVPIGDELLFSEYNICLNIGGFANVSYHEHGVRKAFDVCPANIVLNSLAQKTGSEFDNNGQIARSGQINANLLQQLNELDYYFSKPPKSLGVEWLNAYFFPILDNSNVPVQDKLCTVCEHIAVQIGQATGIVHAPKPAMLVTGGGAYNTYLIQRIEQYTPARISIPENSIVEYKEALVFALLGVLRIRNEINCLASVTGAKHDSSCGVIFNPQQGVN